MTKPFLPHSPRERSAGTPDKAQEILRRLRQAAEKSRAENAGGPSRPASAARPSAGDGGDERGDASPDLDEVLFPPPAPRRKSAFPVLAAIFMVSAIAGGGLAGLMLSMRGGGPARVLTQNANQTLVPASPAPAREAAKSAPPEAGSAAGENAPAAAGGKNKDDERIAPPPAAASSKPAPQERLAMAPPPPPIAAPLAQAAPPPAVTGRKAAADVSKTPAPVAPPPAGTPETTTAADAPEAPGAPAAPAPAENFNDAMTGMAGDAGTLKALTDNVVRALGGLRSAGAAPRAAGDLRQALSSLVSKALSEGRSQDEIAGLLSRALKDSNQSLPEALKGPDGKVDIRVLISSVIPREDAVAYVNEKDRGDMAMLIAEGEKASLTGDERTSKDRFYTRDGKRYTKILPGDTLSHISFAAYGDIFSYPLILSANAGRISVRNLKPGVEIRIPDRGEIALAPPPAAKPARAEKAKPAARSRSARKARRKQSRRPRPTAARKITDRLLGAIASPAPVGQSPARPPVKPVTNFSPAARP